MVDDEPSNLIVLGQILKSHRLCNIAMSLGPDALELLAASEFDAVLMDIHMPGQDGVELLRLMRAASGPNRHSPVIALTADTVSRTRDQYVRLGFFDLITKPVTPDGVIGCVLRAALMKPRLRDLKRPSGLPAETEPTGKVVARRGVAPGAPR